MAKEKKGKEVKEVKVTKAGKKSGSGYTGKKNTEVARQERQNKEIRAFIEKQQQAVKIERQQKAAESEAARVRHEANLGNLASGIIALKSDVRKIKVINPKTGKPKVVRKNWVINNESFKKLVDLLYNASLKDAIFIEEVLQEQQEAVQEVCGEEKAKQFTHRVNTRLKAIAAHGGPNLTLLQ